MHYSFGILFSINIRSKLLTLFITYCYSDYQGLSEYQEVLVFLPPQS